MTFHAAEAAAAAADEENENQQYLSAIAAAKAAKASGTEFSYDDRDIILYNLGLGATPRDQHLIYENDDAFRALPTWGVIPPFNASAPFSLADLVPNFSPMLLLHGEQYLELLSASIPTEARVVSFPQLVDVVDKGKSAVITTGTTTVDKESGKKLFYNEMTVVVRGAGGFGGERKPSTEGAGRRVEDGGRGHAVRNYEVPKRAADEVVQVRTAEGQAALYRLSGDRNPLHIDPAFAAVGGFEKPILHGLCSMGVAVKAVVEAVEGRVGGEGGSAGEGGSSGGTGGSGEKLRVKSIKTRFVGTVVPGQGIKVEMWREGKGGRTVVFRASVVETGKVALLGGVEFVGSDEGEGEGEVKARL